LRRNDPVVALIHAAMTTRRIMLDLARRALHFIRGR
jgi:hypothetical protein